jgi:spore coat polysaccharide biosynthesis protein SpsF
MTKFVAVLACRVQSERLYAKPLQLVGGKPILQHVIDRIKEQCKSIDEVILAISENPENIPFETYAKEHNIKYVYGDENDVLGRLIKAGHAAEADVILRSTTENPFIYVKTIDEMYKKHVEEKADISVCEEVPVGAYVEIITLKALEQSHADGEDKHRSELCTLYIKENPDKFKKLSYKVDEEIRRPEIRLTVDNPEDLIVVRKIWDAIGTQEGVIPLADIIKFLDENPEIKAINSGILAGTAKTWK